ncbi:serine carboxypeptidase-domain-containing protein [Pilaira anomala]|nr:serine carboxypeptidase-domain-containing protein [Pilaira anomala]
MRKGLFGLLTLCGTFITVLTQSAEDYKVTSLPGIDVDTLNFTQYAGHIELSSENKASMFFWMIEREVKTEPEKLIIWLNGGPGCSSMDGLFLENGPYRVNKNLSLSINPGGWQNYATNVYVDQPVGTGFSFASTNSYMHSMEETTEQFILFLDKLLEIFPELSKQDMYIAGESYAGTYIPYFTAKILELNKEKQKYNLQGIAIGNGWISAEHQYNAYYDYSVAYGLIQPDRASLVSTHLKNCQNELKNKELIHVSPCEKILSDVIDSSTHEDANGDKRCLNIYDIRLKEEMSPECGSTWPYELTEVTAYLRQSEVKQAIHAEKQILGWKECTSLVYSELSDDKSRPSYELLPGILEKIPILLFSGEYDLICNYIGTEYLIGNMTWNGSTGFSKKTKKEDWKIDNKVVGYYTEERNLSYVLIKDGSHMVPYDRPIECLDMINRFMQVGDNVVKGKKSQVGGRDITVTPPPKEAEEEKGKETQDKADDEEKDTDSEKMGQETGEDEWSKYYSWGTTTLVFVILFAIALCCCWCRGSRPSASALDEFGGAPQREREGVKKPGLFGFIQNLFRSSKNNEGRKFRLGDNDESNELDELVIETPTLFEAEEGDSDEEEINTTNQYRNQNQQQESSGSNRFAIDDEETDDDFEDFADFDDGEPLTNTKNFKKKD